MTKATRIQKRLVLLIAFSIIWVFIGSLVVFHQEHVMGKIHKWHNTNFVMPKSKDKLSLIFNHQGNSANPTVELAPAVINGTETIGYLMGSGTSLSQNWNEETCPLRRIQSAALRAPPLA